MFYRGEGFPVDGRRGGGLVEKLLQRLGRGWTSVHRIVLLLHLPAALTPAAASAIPVAVACQYLITVPLAGQADHAVAAPRVPATAPIGHNPAISQPIRDQDA